MNFGGRQGGPVNNGQFQNNFSQGRRGGGGGGILAPWAVERGQMAEPPQNFRHDVRLQRSSSKVLLNVKDIVLMVFGAIKLGLITQLLKHITCSNIDQNDSQVNRFQGSQCLSDTPRNIIV